MDKGIKKYLNTQDCDNLLFDLFNENDPLLKEKIKKINYKKAIKGISKTYKKIRFNISII